jgi:CRISPR/Cas system-associated exonuclease Cas4 (RecB family)
MSPYYNAQRKRNMYDPNNAVPFKLSRSKISDYLNCSRCFYLDRRLGVGQPPGYPFTLNLAVDALLKAEFDVFRANKGTHPLMQKYGITVIPADRPELKTWRENFKGIQFLHEATNLIITGAIDDLWESPGGVYHVVDYKATSRKEPVTEINPDYGYIEQMEVYQWLLRMNGLNVSNTGYFVYANGKKEGDFGGLLEFDMTIIHCEGNDSWIEPTIEKIHACLVSDTIPPAADDCDYCAYVAAREKHGAVR